LACFSYSGPCSVFCCFRLKMNIQGRDFMAACERLENLLKNNERENLKPKTALNAFLDSFRSLIFPL